MYQKYHTEALVLGNRVSGEADRTIALYTKEFGLIRARARAVRAEKSKMRYAVQNYSRASVSLVRGSGGWRLAGARALSGSEGADPRSIAAFARIAELVTRLVAGEESNEYLFEVLSHAHAALMENTSRAATAPIELLCVARTLFALGYISSEALGTALFAHTAYTEPHLREAKALEPALIASINRAITETHL
ncbi:MAG: repair protein RecO protein [Parcubacteria group bacterium GW2011_GWA2_51_10]|nr:MAG: repair protein RecO protein [Parcubacteria group bacterium GW2011_GWA2_51_10]